MSGGEVALDTSVAIAVLKDAVGIRSWIQRFETIYLPVPVIGELHFGALNSQRPQENLRRVQKLVHRCRILSIHSKTAMTYAQIRLQLKEKGKPIPENDIWIAALCRSKSLPLATEDAHFLEVDDLIVETPSPHP